MQLQSINLILTPFIIGFVGYITNWLAIKMLFRPHRRRWYSFGWIGVIPKNRAKLSSKVGVMVGEKLIGEEEITKVLRTDNVKNTLSATIETELTKFLKNDHGTISEILEKTGLQKETVIKKLSELLEDEATTKGITEAVASISAHMFEKLADTQLNTLIPEKGVDNMLKNAFTNGKWQAVIINELSNKLNNLVLSGKSLSDILPDKVNSSTNKMSDFLTDKSLDILNKMFEDEESCKKIANKLIALKDGLFKGGGIDQLKLGFLNMFLNEDTIQELVQKHLPNLIAGIKEDSTVKKRISTGIKVKIDEFIQKPLYAHAGKIGFETVYEIRGEYISKIQKYLASESFIENISQAIENTLSDSNITIDTLASTLGINLKDEKTINSIISKLAGSQALKSTLPYAVYKILQNVRVSNIYDSIPSKSFSEAVNRIQEGTNRLLEKNIPGIMRAINLSEIVERKVNTLNLYEVEDILFGFMKDQFKWINILGFALGFLFGLIQVGIVVLFK